MIPELFASIYGTVRATGSALRTIGASSFMAGSCFSMTKLCMLLVKPKNIQGNRSVRLRHSLPGCLATVPSCGTESLVGQLPKRYHLTTVHHTWKHRIMCGGFYLAQVA
jgi:hypothetical protein